MWYDICVLLLCLNLFGSGIFFVHQHAWMDWTAAWYANITYSLCMLPYLLLGVPGVFSVLTNTSPTGYDQAGSRCGKLTPAQMRRKRELDEADGIETRSEEDFFFAPAAAMGVAQSASAAVGNAVNTVMKHCAEAAGASVSTTAASASE